MWFLTYILRLTTCRLLLWSRKYLCTPINQISWFIIRCHSWNMSKKARVYCFKIENRKQNFQALVFFQTLQLNGLKFVLLSSTFSPCKTSPTSAITSLTFKHHLVGKKQPPLVLSKQLRSRSILSGTVSRCTNILYYAVMK